MISGAVLLGKDEPLADVVKKRVIKYAGILFAVSSIHCAFQKRNITLIDFLKAIYSTQVTVGLWFLYQYLSFLLALPLLRKLAKNMAVKDYLWLSVLMLLFPVLKTVDFLVFHNQLSYNSIISSPFVTQIVYFPLMGYFLTNKVKLESISKQHLLICLALSVIAILFSGWMTCLWYDHLGEWNEATGQNFLQHLIFIPACFLFLLTRYVFSKIKVKPAIEKAITILGSSAFGIYLFEELYRRYTMPVFIKVSKYLPSIVACTIWVFSIFLLGFFVTQIWKFLTRSIKHLLNRESKTQSKCF